jgi:hypothetical protein
VDIKQPKCHVCRSHNHNESILFHIRGDFLDPTYGTTCDACVFHLCIPTRYICYDSLISKERYVIPSRLLLLGWRFQTLSTAHTKVGMPNGNHLYNIHHTLLWTIEERTRDGTWYIPWENNIRINIPNGWSKHSIGYELYQLVYRSLYHPHTIFCNTHNTPTNHKRTPIIWFLYIYHDTIQKYPNSRRHGTAHIHTQTNHTHARF